MFQTTNQLLKFPDAHQVVPGRPGFDSAHVFQNNTHRSGAVLIITVMATVGGRFASSRCATYRGWWYSYPSEKYESQ